MDSWVWPVLLGLNALVILTTMVTKMAVLFIGAREVTTPRAGSPGANGGAQGGGSGAVRPPASSPPLLATPPAPRTATTLSSQPLGQPLQVRLFRFTHGNNI